MLLQGHNRYAVGRLNKYSSSSVEQKCNSSLGCAMAKTD